MESAFFMLILTCVRHGDRCDDKVNGLFFTQTSKAPLRWRIFAPGRDVEKTNEFNKYGSFMHNVPL